MFDKITQKIIEKILPIMVARNKLCKKAMLVNTTSKLMASGRYPVGDPSQAFKIAKQIIELAEEE